MFFFLAINLQKQLAVRGTRFLRCLELRSLHAWCNRLKIISIMEINGDQCTYWKLQRWVSFWIFRLVSGGIPWCIWCNYPWHSHNSWCKTTRELVWGQSISTCNTQTKVWYTLVYGIREHFLKWPKQLMRAALGPGFVQEWDFPEITRFYIYGFMSSYCGESWKTIGPMGFEIHLFSSKLHGFGAPGSQGPVVSAATWSQLIHAGDFF